MTTWSGPAPNTADIGRLPAPTIDSPFSEERFRALTQAWSASGIWLTAWNRKGQCVLRDETAPRFWNMLWTRGLSFQRTFAALALDGIKAAEKIDDTLAGPYRPLNDSMPGVSLVLAPIRHHHRVIGAVVGGFFAEAELGESLNRLCDECGLDVAVMRNLAIKAGIAHPEVIAHARRTLPFTVDLACEADIGLQETSALATNLESTYEELHLIYSIGGKLSFTHRPSHVLKQVSKEVFEISRASALAFVLEEVDSEGAPPNVRAGYPMSTLADRIVQSGTGAPTLHDLDRLAESLRLQPDSPVEHVLLNQAARQPELRWADGWLEHLVALPLWHERKLLGIMLAINCNDGGDFTSVDVQFFRAVADRVAPFLANRRLYDDLGELLMGMLHALVNSIDAKDAYTCGHSERVAFLGRALAQAAGLPAPTCERIYLAGLLHDVGKIGVPDVILCKTGKLTAEEFAVMQKHPEIGVRILAGVRQIRDLLPGVLHHHERMDGRGYPEGRAGEDIPLFGRIICIADCFDAMTTNRTYRSALPLPVAVAEVRRCAGTQFDPKLAELFLALDHAKLFAEARAMSTGEDVLGAARGIRVGA